MPAEPASAATAGR